MPLSAVASTIGSAVAPVFLFAGIGGILNVVGARLSRAVDRVRVVEGIGVSPTDFDHQHYSRELAMLERRIKHSNRATTLCVASALAVCLVVVLLFISQVMSFDLGNAIAFTFVIAMVLLAGGLIEFLTEIRVAIRGRRIHRQHIGRPRVDALKVAETPS